ncbi:hypothetical protein BJ944DRAFT_187530 [Cunninghamella echinulata]|nr:hypothetical protein BJ944DRAFT_187530 [Cunninghamella echinulata]
MTYPGYKKLHEFVYKNKDPSFFEFIGTYEQELILWSLDFAHFDPEQLHCLWKKRFVMKLKDMNKIKYINKSKLKFSSEKWEGIKLLIDEAYKTRQQYYIEGLKTLGAMSTTLSRLIKPSIDNTAQNNDNNQKISADLKSLDTISTEHFLREKGYDKLLGAKFNNETINKLKSVDRGDSVKDALLYLASQVLIKDELSSIDECVIKLSLSSIINTINPQIYEIIMESLSETAKNTIYSYQPRINTKGLSEEVCAFYNLILDYQSDIDEMISFIQNKKCQLSRMKQRESDMYKMLTVVERVVENFNLWYNDNHESEITLYRRFSFLLDIIFNGTPVELADGEAGSISTKISKELNKAIFETEEPILTCSRKIDLLLKFNGSELVELSSNEWKRASVSHDVILYQQTKNIRTNASILSNLMSRYGKEFNTIMAMDWIGNVGYIYFLEMLDNGIIVAKVFDKVIIPTDVSHLSDFKDTLNALFSFKTFIVDLCFKLKKKSQEIEFNNKLFNIIHRNTVKQGPLSPFIFYTPKNQRIKKRKLISFDEDD